MLMKYRILDHVGHRSMHSFATPRGAGLVQMVGITAGLVSVRALNLTSGIAILGFAVLGAWDDWRARSASIRFFAQVVLASAVVMTLQLGVMPPLTLGITITAVAIAGFVVIVNSVNFMDGINGISASHGILFGLVYALLLWRTGSVTWIFLGLCLAVASAVLLPWNFRKTALIFLGDSGSYLLGATVSLLILVSWSRGLPLLIALAPLTIYLSDVFVTMARRLVLGKSLTQAHREHAYQLLPTRGGDHRSTSLLVLMFSTACCILALLAQLGILTLPLLALLLLLVVFSYFVTIRVLSR